MRNMPFAICIVGKDQESYLEQCIRHASKISRELVYVDLGSKDNSVKKAEELGAKAIKTTSSLEEAGRLVIEATSSDWVLFLRPDERLMVRSKRNLEKILKNKDVDAYVVTTKKIVKYDLLEPFQLIKKLDQFKNVKHSLYIPELQIRLVHQRYVPGCLDFMISSNTERLAEIRNKIIEDIIIIESIQPDEKDEPLPVEDHDLRCLKGELCYDPTPEENLVELSERFTGFRVLHGGYLDSFLEGARLGFGNFKIYIPMLKFLGDHGYFKKARDLFETWIQNRSEDEIHDTNMMGGVIYSNLFELDKAIQHFEKCIEVKKNSHVLANIAKLYLIKGEKEKAIEYFKEVEDAVGDVYLKDAILSIIDRPDWRPMRLSLCMIARDEEASIKKALESVQGIVDEIIVVDTGSSDRTKEIVREFGGKVVEMEWQDDFSAARNRCLKEATGDYVLWMDADEYIDARHLFSLALLKKLLPAEKDLAFMTKVEPPKKEKALSVQAYLDRLKEYEIVEYQVRFFPRKTGIEFKGILFESLDESLRHLGIKVDDNDLLRITHSMDNREFREKRKSTVALRSFDSICEPEKVVEGGLLFLRLGEFDKAYPWFEKAEIINPQLASKIALLYSRQGENHMAKAIIEKALEHFPKSFDLTLSMAEIYHKEGRYSEVVKLLAERIESVEEQLEQEDANSALFYYGIALLETGDMARGIDQIAKAREKEPANTMFKVAGIYTFAKVDQWEEALRGTAEVADEEGIDGGSEVNDFVDVGRIFMEMNHHFAQAGKTEEADLCQKIVEDVVKSKISGEEDIQRMSEVIEGMG